MKHIPMGRKNTGVGGRRPRGPSSGGPGKPTARTTAFDLYVNKGLHAMYDSVKDEDVPDSLLRLILEDSKKKGEDQAEPKTGQVPDESGPVPDV